MLAPTRLLMYTRHPSAMSSLAVDAALAAPPPPPPPPAPLWARANATKAANHRLGLRCNSHLPNSCLILVVR
jgi:hypothetical protein